MNMDVYRNLSYGLYVVSTLDGERGTGCITNSVMQVTAEPATIAVSINHDNYTNQCIDGTGKFSISILAEDSSPSIISKFGFQSGRDVDKYADTDCIERDGLPVVSDTCGYLICKVINKMETSTHTVFLGEVTDGDVLRNAPAMTYAYYHKVIKGKTPKNAPTYLSADAAGRQTPNTVTVQQTPNTPTAQQESNLSMTQEQMVQGSNVSTGQQTPNVSAAQQLTDSGISQDNPVDKKRWICSVCGYIYEGETPFEELPADYTCPICKNEKGVFERL